MTPDEITVTGHVHVEEDPTWVHPVRERGRAAGRMIAGDEEKLCAVMEAALACGLDETYPEDIREKALLNCLGVAEGYREMMMEVPFPMQFLTRVQTARVLGLPRIVRRAWMSHYNRGVRHWVKQGGSLSGKRPMLPEIP